MRGASPYAPDNLRGVVTTAGTNGSSDGAAKLDRWSRAQGRVFLGMTEVEGEDKWSGPFVFACLADTQLGALDDNVVSLRRRPTCLLLLDFEGCDDLLRFGCAWLLVWAWPGRQKWDDEVDLCRKAVECLNALKPR